MSSDFVKRRRAWDSAFAALENSDELAIAAGSQTERRYWFGISALNYVAVARAHRLFVLAGGNGNA